MPQTRTFRVIGDDGASERWVTSGGDANATVTYHGEAVSVQI